MPKTEKIKKEILSSSRHKDKGRVARKWANTFFFNKDAATAAARLLMSCVAKGEFLVRDFSTTVLQRPHTSFSIADYLSHGSRIVIDYHELSPGQRDELLRLIPDTLNPDCVARSATHDASRNGDGLIIEGKGFLLGMKGQLPSVLKSYCDFGINIAMGGNGQTNEVGKTIRSNGYSGHFYIHRNDAQQLLMLGLEQTAPVASLWELFHQKKQDAEQEQWGTDQYGQGHSLTGASDTYTAAGSLYFSDPVLQVKCLVEDHCFPPDKYGAMQVKLTNENWLEIKKMLEEMNQANQDRLFHILIGSPVSATKTPRKYSNYLAVDFRRYFQTFSDVFLDSAQKNLVKDLQNTLLKLIREFQEGIANYQGLESCIQKLLDLPLPAPYKKAISDFKELLAKQLEENQGVEKNCQQFFLDKEFEELQEEQLLTLQKLSLVENFFITYAELFKKENEQELSDFIEKLQHCGNSLRSMTEPSPEDMSKSWHVLPAITAERIAQFRLCLLEATNLLANIPQLYLRTEWEALKALVSKDKAEDLKLIEELRDKNRDLQSKLDRANQVEDNLLQRVQQIATVVQLFGRIEGEVNTLKGEARQEGDDLVKTLRGTINNYLTNMDYKLNRFQQDCSGTLAKPRENLYQRSSLLRLLVQEALTAVCLLFVGYAAGVVHNYTQCGQLTFWNYNSRVGTLKKELEALVQPPISCPV
ncbi:MULTISPECIES: hypothetical protein [unclassified Legionella]|uniref:hypothetical protein n=1 Tax=unclassified Legionella TaxID=2622702 RepID=UPI001E4A1A9C|nr:hypothetical protein [Legionella sp. 31fI33]MCC5013824.1 hypothetical protein [Legionella sp. 31fI33]